MNKFREIDSNILIYFDYNPKTGNFYRLPRPHGQKSKEGLLTSKKRGYINIRWNKIDYSAARVAFKFMGVDVPNDKMVDHINGNRADNRFINLRIVSKQNNEANRKEHKKKLPGCIKKRGRFEAYIRKNGKRIYLGSSKSELECHYLYVKGFKDIHGTDFIPTPQQEARRRHLQ